MIITRQKKHAVTLLLLLITSRINVLYSKHLNERHFTEFHNYSGHVHRNNAIDSGVIKRLHLLFKPSKSCEIKIQYPQLVENKKSYKIEEINREIKKFFGINNYLNADFRSDLCPAHVYNFYKLKQTKPFISISNSTVTFFEGAPHSTKYTTSTIINKTTGRPIKNRDFFKENLVDSLKLLLLNKIQLIYENYKIPNFNRDYYNEELNGFNFSMDEKLVVFYLKDDKEDFMGELEVPVEYVDIQKFIKDQYR